MKKTSKTILLALLVLIIVVALAACQKPLEIQTQNPDGTLTVTGVLIEQAVTTVARLLEALVLAYGAWALEKIGKSKKLQNLNLAFEELCSITKQTVRELNQTTVTRLKETSSNGKLTQVQINALKDELLVLVKAKASEASIQMITAAGADLDALIIGQCEAFLDALKEREKLANP